MLQVVKEALVRPSKVATSRSTGWTQRKATCTCAVRTRRRKPRVFLVTCAHAQIPGMHLSQFSFWRQTTGTVLAAGHSELLKALNDTSSKRCHSLANTVANRMLIGVDFLGIQARSTRLRNKIDVQLCAEFVTAGTFQYILLVW